jgi:hypothetical protein
MPRPIRVVDIYLPLDYNDGHPIEAKKYIPLEDELLTRFGRITSTQRLFPLRGLWQSGAVVFQDRVVVFSALDSLCYIASRGHPTGSKAFSPVVAISGGAAGSPSVAAGTRRSSRLVRHFLRSHQHGTRFRKLSPRAPLGAG